MEKPEDEIKRKTVQLGERIKDLRIKAGYSNYEYFAFENEISRSLYYKWESGRDMQFSSIVRICRAHSMSLIEFFSEGFDWNLKPISNTHSGVYSVICATFLS